MKDKTYNNADSFAISFDEEWQKVSCNDIVQKIDKVIASLRKLAETDKKVAEVLGQFGLL